MSLWSRFPFVRITIALIAGILVAFYCKTSLYPAIGLLFGLLGAYVAIIIFVSPAQHPTWSPLMGLLGLASVFLIGYLRLDTSKGSFTTDHLTRLETLMAYEAVALEDAVEKSGRCNVIVNIRRARIQGIWQQVTGKVRLSFPKAAIPAIHYGHVLLVYGAPSRVPSPKNPFEFDYAQFLSISQIYHQHFLEAKELFIVGYAPPNHIQSGALKVLRYCRSLLSRYIQHPETLAVVQAIVLGQKDDLTKETRSIYTGTGTMHVLAVSGLHVGILYWLLGFLLYLLNRLPYSRQLSPALIVSTLWFYAFITGLSPSVIRATLMFTLVLLAPMLSRQSHIYNTLASSAFLILFWNPWWLFSVSFQLSYLAVLGIVYLQPRIYSSIPVRHSLLHQLWVWSSISLAAQIATGPISLYYFHQFPTYFLIANWIMVPAALLIFCMGLLVFATGFFPSLSELVAWILIKVVKGVNTTLGMIQALPYSIVEDIYLSTAAVILVYGLLCLWLLFWHTRQLRYGVACGTAVIIFSAYTINMYCAQRKQRQVVFYSIGRHCAVGFFKGNEGFLCTDKHFAKRPDKYDYHIQPSQIAWGITSLARHTFDSAMNRPDFPSKDYHGIQIVVWQGKRFAFVHQRKIALPELTTKVHVDYLIVERDAVNTLLPIIKRFTFDTLVIGASNTQRTVEQLQTEAYKHRFSSHSLRHQGALTISW